MNSELSWLILSTVFLFVGIVLIYWVHNQGFIEIITPTSIPPKLSPTTLISIIVPARHEARNTRRCLGACRAMHISPWYALTLPLGALVFTLMMFTSAYKILSGQGVTWRGRSYA